MKFELPDINLEQIQINNKMYEVVTLAEYMKNSDLYTTGRTAIKIEGQNVVLPLVSKYDVQKKVPGISVIPNCLMQFYYVPENSAEYSTDKIINISNRDTVSSLIAKQEQVRNMEHECLTNSDNVTVPKIGDHDSPEMVGLKQAIIAKQFDINLYKDRFKGNFSNDRRILSDSKISLDKLVKFAKALDMKITMEISDSSPDVPNPMNSVITVDITGGGED